MNAVYQLKVMRCLLSGLSFVFFINLLGCASQPSPVSTEEVKEDSDLVWSNEQPYDLEIVKETNDGQLLSLVVRFQADSRLVGAREGDKLRVVFSLYADGVREWRREQPIEQLVELDGFTPVGPVPLAELVGRDLLLQAKLPSSSITDYQLSLEWGTGSSTSADRLMRSASVKRGGESCDGGSCVVDYEIELELVNPFPRPVGRISVDTWYAKDPLADPTSATGDQPDPSARAHLALEGVELAPRESASVVVQLSEPLPQELEADGISPQIKVLGFEFLDHHR